MPYNGVEGSVDRAGGRGTKHARGHLRLVAGGADAPSEQALRADDADAQPPNDGDGAPVGFTLLTW
ncbi:MULTISPECIES: hypothetical protein [unclassified Mycolicibacterium]|uniref:hypothetical protein n=1 Tax=unclassified Mycolicibacterium TaxID=2636767 RepID=UPI002ED80DF4